MVAFNRPLVTGREPGYMQQAMASGQLSMGPFTQRCSDWLKERYQTEAALLTHSGTAALELSMLLLDIGPGDEVIVPSFTFVTSASAIALRGATPVFVDVRPDTLNIDPDAVAKAITPQTKAIMVVHYAGVGCEMDAIKAFGLPIVEDAAHAMEATLDGKALGTIGDLGCLSFHETKNLTCGEGGALLVNRPELVPRAEILHMVGTNRSAFQRGEVDRYTWVALGSSFRTSELPAAYLWAQLEEADTVTAHRRALWDRYHAGFEQLETDGKLTRPTVPDGCEHNAHTYYLLLDERDALIAGLAQRDVDARFHYVPLHSSPAGAELGRPGGTLAVTDSVAARLVRMPMHYELTFEDVDRVVAAVTDVLTPPKASVVIRTQNHADALTKNLSLLARQTLPHEVIVVDSGSDDDTVDIARAAGAVVVDRSAEPFHYAATLNAGCAIARAPVLVSLSAHAFPQSDDFLERVVAHFDDPEVACVYGEQVDEDFNPLLGPYRQDAALAAARPFYGFSNTGGAVRAELWKQHAFREDLASAEDREWGSYWCERGYVCVLDPAVAVERDYSKDSLRACFARYRTEYTGYRGYLDLPRYNAAHLVREWWADQGGHRSRLRARLDPRRAARLSGKWWALR
jgi:dTDP-4-amino-4,6-dideoxygalactose transaminase